MIPLFFDALAGLSWVLWIVVPVLVVWFGVAYFLERDAQASGKRVAGGVGVLGVSVVAVVTGMAEGLAGAGGGVLGVLAPHLDVLAHVGIAWAGWSGLRGGLLSDATTFAVFALLLLVVSLVWGE